MAEKKKTELWDDLKLWEKKQNSKYVSQFWLFSPELQETKS